MTFPFLYWLRSLRIALLALVPAAAVAADETAHARELMVAQIAATARELAPTTGRAALDARVIEAIGRVPRHLFVPAVLRSQAYDNRPLPIGEGQTISQPFITALMIDLARPRANSKVLEIGTGSGYQAAVLAELCKSVYSIEIVASLGNEARDRLQSLGYRNVEVRIGDGYAGWPERGPFDAIILSASADRIPPPLVVQLAPGGRLVMPLGPSSTDSELVVVEKQADGSARTLKVLPVNFAPLMRGPPR